MRWECVEQESSESRGEKESGPVDSSWETSTAFTEPSKRGLVTCTVGGWMNGNVTVRTVSAASKARASKQASKRRDPNVRPGMDWRRMQVLMVGGAGMESACAYLNRPVS
jgi:hypothetical protein